MPLSAIVDWPTMNLLFDTNVLIDYLGRKEPFFANAERIVAAGFFGDATLWMAAQSPKDAFYVLERYIDPQRIQQALLKAYEIITPVALTTDDLATAARLQWDDYEDCLVALAAQKARADYLITRDAKGFERSMVPALSPTEWLVLRERDGIIYDAVDLPPEEEVGP